MLYRYTDGRLNRRYAGEQIRELIEEQWFIQEGKFRKIADFDLTFSYGIVDVPEQAQGYDRVMQVADERMYLFKRLHKQKAQ